MQGIIFVDNGKCQVQTWLIRTCHLLDSTMWINFTPRIKTVDIPKSDLSKPKMFLHLNFNFPLKHLLHLYEFFKYQDPIDH